MRKPFRLVCANIINPLDTYVNFRRTYLNHHGQALDGKIYIDDSPLLRTAPLRKTSKGFLT